MIRTPVDFLGYLRYLAQQHPYVGYVLHGEDLRREDATLARVRYPLVDIETPVQTIPLDDGQSTISSRLFITDRSQQGHAYEDIALDRCYYIAMHLIRAIREHASGGTFGDDARLYGFTLAAPIELRPVMMATTDQTKGWTFEVTILVNQELCIDLPFRPAQLMFPQFTWANSESDPTGGIIALTNISIETGADSMQFIWEEEYEQQTPAVLIGTTITLTPIADGPDYRTIRVWLKVQNGDTILWAYAHIDTRLEAGVSTPFTPYIPEI